MVLNVAHCFLSLKCLLVLNWGHYFLAFALVQALFLLFRSVLFLFRELIIYWVVWSKLTDTPNLSRLDPLRWHGLDWFDEIRMAKGTLSLWFFKLTVNSVVSNEIRDVLNCVICRWAIFWLLAKKHVYKSSKFCGIDVRNLLVSLVRDHIAQGHQIISLKRWLEASKVVEGATYCPNVDFVIVRLGLDHFWSQVQRCTDPRPLEI